MMYGDGVVVRTTATSAFAVSEYAIPVIPPTMNLMLSPPAAPEAKNVTFVAPVAIRLPGDAPQLFTGYCQ
jgi:hypothetical protein